MKHGPITRRLLTSTVGVLIAATAVACGGGGDEKAAVPTPAPKRLDTAEQAAEVILKARPGRIGTLETDEDNGVPIWGADVLGDDGAWHEVRVGLADGRLIADEKQDNAGEDAEDRTDRENRERALRAATVTVAQAASTARTKVPGTVGQLDFDAPDGRYLWTVDVTPQNGKARELTIDPKTAKILTNTPDNDEI